MKALKTKLTNMLIGKEKSIDSIGRYTKDIYSTIDIYSIDRKKKV